MPDDWDRSGEAPPAGRGSAARSPGWTRRGAGGSRSRSRRLRGRPRLLVVGAVLTATLAAVAACGGGSGGSGAVPSSRTPLSSAASSALQSVPLPVLRSASPVGTELTPATPLAAPVLSAQGRPQVLYIGAEFCPYCAAQRWPLVVALARFGTFAGLKETTTGPAEGDLPTISFYGSTYSSPYVVFTPVEVYGNQRKGDSYEPLETLAPEQRALWTSTLKGQLSFPFVDMGGRYLLDTSQFPPALLKGQSFDSIVAAVRDNTTPTGATINAAASVLVGYICTLTGQQPASVCAAPSP